MKANGLGGTGEARFADLGFACAEGELGANLGALMFEFVPGAPPEPRRFGRGKSSLLHAVQTRLTVGTDDSDNHFVKRPDSHTQSPPPATQPQGGH